MPAAEHFEIGLEVSESVSEKPSGRLDAWVFIV
jgi:hypothetical protein